MHGELHKHTKYTVYVLLSLITACVILIQYKHTQDFNNVYQTINTRSWKTLIPKNTSHNSDEILQQHNTKNKSVTILDWTAYFGTSLVELWQVKTKMQKMQKVTTLFRPPKHRVHTCPPTVA
jgi:hypothetical protein